MQRIKLYSFLLMFFITTLFDTSSGDVVDGWPDRSLNAEWSKEVQVDKKRGGEEILQALMSGDDCFGKKCMSSDQCCKGSVCVDAERAKVGTCLPVYGRSDGSPCEEDVDCDAGFRCVEDRAQLQPGRACHPDARELEKKQYNDECQTSAECDAGKGLCCQVMRRHRQAPRRLCYYFTDPKSCIGKTDTKLKPIDFMPNSFFKARLG